jgi:predicted nucleic acid-binding protein
MGNLYQKHLLLDTCFLTKAHQYSDTNYFDELFSVLSKNKCIPVINDHVRFEFLRGCKTKEHVRSKKEWLDYLVYVTLPITPDIKEDAINIANVYANKNIKDSISLADCYISSFLKKHDNDLVFITLNHKDFPLLIHNRLHVHSIDAEKEILTPAFYQFDLEKYKQCINIFK